MDENADNLKYWLIIQWNTLLGAKGADEFLKLCGIEKVGELNRVTDELVIAQYAVHFLEVMNKEHEQRGAELTRMIKEVTDGTANADQ